MDKPKKRIRCSDEKFLEAVYSSSTYAEISEKTGQKITTTIARYSRIKSLIKSKQKNLPIMQRKKIKQNYDTNYISNIIQQLKDIRFNQ